MSGLDRAFQRSDRIVTRRIAGECVLVPLASRGADIDAIFSLNRSAAFIWDRLDGRSTGRQIVAALGEAFEVDSAAAERDYLALIETLAKLAALASDPLGAHPSTLPSNKEGDSPDDEHEA